MMLKALPLVHFWSVLLLKEQVVTSVRKTLKMLVWSAQNRSISSEICVENNHKIGRFLLIAFWWSLPQKLQRNSREISRFFREFVPNNPAKFDFFFHVIYNPLYNSNGHKRVSLTASTMASFFQRLMKKLRMVMKFDPYGMLAMTNIFWFCLFIMPVGINCLRYF